MMILPRDVGPFRLLRKLGTGPVSETYAGVDTSKDNRRVVVRRILPFVQQDRTRLAGVEARVKDLLEVRHPFLAQVLDWLELEEERYIVGEWVQGVDLERLISWCRQHDISIPPNVYLSLATQICNGLEALHGRPGKASGAENVLHLGLRPSALILRPDGKVQVGSFALIRSPTALSHGAVSDPIPTQMEYLSPEQTHPAQKLAPSSDVFSLGGNLYELQALQPLYRTDTAIQTIQRVRKAEITSQLANIQEAMPGLNKVLARALSVNPRHRYQRAFVLREDLRGLMAGYSFANIGDEMTAFLGPILGAEPEPAAPGLVDAAPDAPEDADDFSEQIETRIDPDPISTAADTARVAAERASQRPFPKDDRIQSGNDPDEASTMHSMPKFPPPPVVERDAPSLPAEAASSPEAGEPVEAPSEVNEALPEPTEAPLESPKGPPEATQPPPEPTEAPLELNEEPSEPVQAGFPDLKAETRDAPAQEVTREVAPKPLAPPSPPPAPKPVPTADPVPAPPAYPSAETRVPAGGDGTWELPEDNFNRPNSSKLPWVAAGLAALLVTLLLLVGGKDDPTVADAEEIPAVEVPAAALEAPEAVVAAEAAEAVEPEQLPADEPARAAPGAKARSATPAPRSTRSASPRRPAPTQRVDSPPPVAGSSFDASLSLEEEDPTAYEVPSRASLESFASSAAAGNLSQENMRTLERVPSTDGSFTRSRALLLMNAEANRNGRAVKRYLDQLMSLEENRYNPVYLSKRARWFANQRKYDKALRDAQKAEQHWARIAPELVFDTKTEIYEVEAASLQGMFYASEDLEALDQAIRSWLKYQRHVQSRERMDLVARSEEQIAKLKYARDRLD